MKHVLTRRPEDRTTKRAVPVASDDEKLRVRTPAEQYLACAAALDDFSHDHVRISFAPTSEAFRQNCPFPLPDCDLVGFVLCGVWKT